MADDKNLLIRIDGDSRGLQSEFARLKSQTENLENNLSSIARTSAVAFAGLTAAIVGTVASYRDAEQANFRTEAVLKSTGFAAGVTAQEVQNLASELEGLTTYSDETIQAGENLLLTFTKIGRDVFPQATEVMLDMSTALGQDLSSSAIQLGKALQDPIIGVTALRRVGVNFSESQTLVIKNLVETNQLAKAQALILKELETEFGGAAKAAAQGTGSFIQMKNALDNVFEAIGKNITQVLLPFSNKLKEIFSELGKNEAFTTTTSYVLLFGAALTGIITVMASLGLGILGLRAGLLALGISFSATWAAATLGLSLLVPAIAFAVEKFIGFDRLVTGAQAGWEFFTQFTTSAVNSLIIKLNELVISMKEVAVSSLEALPGDAFSERTQSMIQNINQLKDENAGLIKSNADLGKSYDEIYDNINTEKLKQKREEEQRIEDEARLKKYEQEVIAEQQHHITLENQKAVLKQESRAREAAQAEIEKAEKELAEIEELGNLSKLMLKRQVELKKDIEARKKQRDAGLSDDKKAENDKNDAIRVADTAQNKARLEYDREFRKELLSSIIDFGNAVVAKGTGVAKALFLIQKASALVDVVINTQRAAALATATIPPPFGEAVAAQRIALGAIQAATIVATTFTGFSGAANGALVGDGGGSLALGDRHPFMLERGELVVPRRNFNEVVEATAKSRGFSDIGGSNGNSSVTVLIEMNENAAQMITARQFENSTLGVDRT